MMLALVIVVYAVLVVAWLAARAIWGDKLLVIAVINSFPTTPFVFVPVVLLLAALDRRPLVIIAALVPVVLWVGLFGWRFLPRMGRAEASAPTLRVMAFNVLWSNKDIEGMAAVIEQYDPDLIALPELTDRQEAALVARLGDRYPYRLRESLSNAHFGTGLFSRWPVRSLGSLQTGLGLRSAAADVETPSGIVRFVAAHPRATEGTRRSLAALFARMTESFRGREAQLAAICRYLDEWGDRPVIVSGDFNMSEFHDAYQCIGQRMTDAYRETGRGYGFTWPGGAFNQGWLRKLLLQTRIDYVFHSRHFRPVSAEVSHMQTGSDHWILVSDLSVGDLSVQ
jgi:vancomycin resistance protein VanJ